MGTRRHFSVEEIAEIQQRLATLAVRDTDMTAVNYLTENDTFAVVQDGNNRKSTIKGLSTFILGDSKGEKGDKGDKGEKGEKGDKGDKGDTGTAATIEVGKVTTSTGQAGSSASATVLNGGTSSAAKLDFSFTLPQGLKGDTGDAAGFGTISATVDANVGTPEVFVSTSGEATAKNITFNFTNLKGQQGETGPVGKGLEIKGEVVGPWSAPQNPTAGDAYYCTDDKKLHVYDGIDWFTIEMAAGTLNTSATTAQTVNASESLGGAVILHKIAKTGTYSDLIGKPSIPTAANDAAIVVKGAGTAVLSTTTNASADASVDIVAGNNVTVTADTKNGKIVVAATDTTYESKAAESGSTAVSLVTAGEKYRWNNKYDKPSDGIPAADIASGVIPSVPAISTDIVVDKTSTEKTASPKAVYDEIHPAVVSSQPSDGMLPNRLYRFGTLTGTVTFSMAGVSDSDITNHWFWTFETGSEAPTITWPSEITSWYSEEAPTIAASKHYEVSVLDGVGICMEV